MSSLCQIIQQILKKRQARKPLLARTQRELAELASCLDDVAALAAAVAISPEAPANLKTLVNVLADGLRNLCTRIADLHAKLANLTARFTKNTINVGVAGQARQGKSTFFQSISGLDNTVIPTNDGLPCTGAKSKIVHQEENSHAIIEFYSRDEFLSGIIHAYYADLGLHPAPNGLDEFRGRLPDLP